MPKTDAGFRVSPIIVPLHSALKECAEFENNSEFLLVNRLGEFHSRTSYRRLWEKIIRKMNAAVGTPKEPEPIKGLRSHILRHTFCTLSGCHPSSSVHSPAAYGSFWYIHDARSIYTSAAGESVYSLSDIPILPRVFSYFTRVKQSNFHKRENTLRAIKVINNLTTFLTTKVR